MPPKKYPFEYSVLDKEMQKQILQQRLQQLEGEHFNHATNRLVVESQPATKETEAAREAALVATDKALAELEAAHRTISSQLASLGCS